MYLTHLIDHVLLHRILFKSVRMSYFTLHIRALTVRVIATFPQLHNDVKQSRFAFFLARRA